MGLRKKEHAEMPDSPLLAMLQKLFHEDSLKLNLLTPIPVPTYQQQRRLPAPQEPFWQVCVGWLRYHHTQVRWDIERALARLFHRRWGS